MRWSSVQSVLAFVAPLLTLPGSGNTLGGSVEQTIVFPTEEPQVTYGAHWVDELSSTIVDSSDSVPCKVLHGCDSFITLIRSSQTKRLFTLPSPSIACESLVLPSATPL